MNGSLSRKSLLINLLGVPIAATAIVSGATPAGAATTAKSAVQYVEKSRNGKYCKNCRFYRGSPVKTGTCTIVEGAIAPLGVCVVYAPK